MGCMGGSRSDMVKGPASRWDFTLPEPSGFPEAVDIVDTLRLAARTERPRPTETFLQEVPSLSPWLANGMPVRRLHLSSSPLREALHIDAQASATTVNTQRR